MAYPIKRFGEAQINDINCTPIVKPFGDQFFMHEEVCRIWAPGRNAYGCGVNREDWDDCGSITPFRIISMTEKQMYVFWV